MSVYNILSHATFPFDNYAAGQIVTFDPIYQRPCYDCNECDHRCLTELDLHRHVIEDHLNTCKPKFFKCNNNREIGFDDIIFCSLKIDLFKGIVLFDC